MTDTDSFYRTGYGAGRPSPATEDAMSGLAHLDQLAFQFRFHTGHLRLGSPALSPSVFLNLHDFIQSRDQVGICLLQSFDIDNAALSLFRRFNGSSVQLFRILFLKLVRKIGHLSLGFGSFRRMLDPERDHHLIFPQRDRIHQR